jgi:hypothetical protein
LDGKNKSRYLDFLHKYNTLMREYEEIVSDSEFDERLLQREPFPPFRERTIYIERQCAFANEQDSFMQMLTLPGQRASGLKEIRDFTFETESLIIVDPYIFSGASNKAGDITDDFKKSVRAAGKHIKRIHFVYDTAPGNTTNAIRSSIKEMLKDGSIIVTEVQSGILHDRIWISDRKKAIVVGTSLNGIGGRVAFILPLPDEDLNSLIDYLDQNNLSRSPS